MCGSQRRHIEPRESPLTVTRPPHIPGGIYATIRRSPGGSQRRLTRVRSELIAQFDLGAEVGRECGCPRWSTVGRERARSASRFSIRRPSAAAKRSIVECLWNRLLAGTATSRVLLAAVSTTAKGSPSRARISRSHPGLSAADHSERFANWSTPRSRYRNRRSPASYLVPPLRDRRRPDRPRAAVRPLAVLPAVSRDEVVERLHRNAEADSRSISVDRDRAFDLLGGMDEVPVVAEHDGELVGGSVDPLAVRCDLEQLSETPIL